MKDFTPHLNFTVYTKQRSTFFNDPKEFTQIKMVQKSLEASTLRQLSAVGHKGLPLTTAHATEEKLSGATFKRPSSLILDVGTTATLPREAVTAFWLLVVARDLSAPVSRRRLNAVYHDSGELFVQMVKIFTISSFAFLSHRCSH
ncbi:hypothetical protein RvY_18359 [Ramazzottius varieornatus]|uniref:Uncharacterized protein n=1 Tax=Ramazzottius varieornatus TaxID=947166 RepID=A0A1D1W5H0_RAMVA|nr:hypothetical protein RvY_18359 [Ramazzottius varieornatus]